MVSRLQKYLWMVAVDTFSCYLWFFIPVGPARVFLAASYSYFYEDATNKIWCLYNHKTEIKVSEAFYKNIHCPQIKKYEYNVKCNSTISLKWCAPILFSVVEHEQ